MEQTNQNDSMSARNTEYSKQQLARQGYVLSNLWHVQDVLQSYEELTVKQAEEVLENALNNERVMERIFEQIDYEVKKLNSRNTEYSKQQLARQGYVLSNLWHIDDVKSIFKCDDDEAQDVLDSALSNEATMNQIWFAIRFHAEDYGLKEIEN